MKAFDDFLRQHIKKTDIFQRTDHCQHAKKTGEGFEIKVSPIGRIGGNKNARHGSGEKGDAHYGVFFDKSEERGRHCLDPFIKK